MFKYTINQKKLIFPTLRRCDSLRHARKKSDTEKERRISSSANKTQRSMTESDFRKKYLYDDSYSDFSKKISSSGYKPRSLDSYIPAERLESRIKHQPKLDETKLIKTRDVMSALEADKRKTRASAAGTAEKSKKAPEKTKKPSEKKPKKTKTKQKGKVRGFMLKVAAFLLVLCLVGGIVLAGICAGMYTAVANELEEMNVTNLALNYSSFVYYNDKDGNAHELLQLHYEGERRIWADSEDISTHLKNAAVAIEDERFYKHNGIDLKRTIGATAGWLLEKVGVGNATYGGSTLTQQLIKNITNEKDKSATRKIKEMMRAIALEKQINDKDAILTMYLNISFFANQCNGVEAASNFYFGKKAKDVSIAEAATIVGITQRPTYYDPVRNPENALTKRNLVLSKMYELDYISKEEYEEAKNSDLGLSKNISQSNKNIYSYFVDQVINDVISDLVEQKGYSQTFAEQQTFSGGFKIYTTMDKSVQSAMEEVYVNRTGFPANKKPQSAMMVVDQYTGEIKGMVGGAGKKTDSRGLNRATHSKRQPGSAIKPISVYAPGIEEGSFNAATVLRDEKITIDKWSPVNAYSGYKGNMTLRRAIEISANIPAVKALQMLGIDKSYNYAKNKFGLSSIVSSDKSLASLALGGLTDGVTVREMAGAYAALANGGKYIEPHTYTKVVDSTGKVILENNPEPVRAVSEATAFIITDMLYGVVNSSGGTGAAAKLPSIPCYGKTGTTNDTKDKWFAGFTKHYTGVVWFGFDQPQSLKRAGISNNPSCVIWKNVMAKINNGLAPEKFEPPASVKKSLICSKTGKLASSGCGYAKREYFSSSSTKGYCKLAHGGGGSRTPSSVTSSSPSPNPPNAENHEEIILPPSADDSNTSSDTPNSVPIKTPEPTQPETPAPLSAPVPTPAETSAPVEAPVPAVPQNENTHISLD